MQKLNKTKNSKRGFTLVELTIVMALVVIISGITVSFSVMMKDLTADNRDEYQFMEHHATLKEEISNWVAENDLAGSTFTVSGDRVTVSFEGSNKEMTLRFSNGTLLYYDNEQNKNVVLVRDLDEIDRIIFSVEGGQKLIRCVTSHENEDTKTTVTNSFVLSLRLGAMVEEGGSL